jgi:hypothetical protein
VTEPFDPRTKLIQLPRRVKDPQTGQWVTRLDDYLEVKWRLVWFREKYPHGTVITEEMCVDLEQGYARFRATVGDGEGGMATGTGTETHKSFEDFVEKAETRALGRALAALGIGTQFVGEELSEGEHVADAPVTAGEHSEKSTSDGSGSAGSAKSPPDAPATVAHPTADEITTLVETARTANVDLEAFGHDMRRLMQLPATQKITKKLLRETMTMEQYHAATAHYGEALRAILEEDVPHFPNPAVPDGNASTGTPISEAPQLTPGQPKYTDSSPASSSAASDDPDAAGEPNATEARLLKAKAKLRQEALGWGLPEREIDFGIGHHPLAAARNLLWRSRRAVAATPIEAVAD